MNKLAVVLIRGLHDLTKEKLDTLKMLNLLRKNSCTVVSDTPNYKGMLNKIKDYVTFGEIDDDTLKMLTEKRAEKDVKDPKKTKPFFRLNSPRKGLGRKGIKWPYTKGGALGYRGKAINDLIKRMV